MPFDPFTQTASRTGNSNGAQVESLADVLSWIDDDACDLESDTRRDYGRAVRLAGKRLRKPLSAIPASADAFRAEFPDAEYSVHWGKSFNAFRRWKGKVCAAINGATGAIAAKAERRGRDDDWRTLVDVLTDVATRKPPEDALFHENEIIGVRALADAARCADVPGPRHIHGFVHDIIAKAADNGQRQAIIDALHLCDRIRTLRDNRLGQLLPDEPIAFSRIKVAKIEIPGDLLAELDIWLDVATRSEWAPTTEAYGKGISRKPYQDATRSIIRTAQKSGRVDLAEIPTIAWVFAESVLTDVVRTWRKNHAESERGAIAPRTAKKYLETVACFLERNGECAHLVKKILATDDWIRSSENGRGMPERAKRLCRRVVTDKPTRLAFLSLHIRYRDAAEDYLMLAETDPKTRAHALTMARQLGTCAAFAALETDAVPVRVSNALSCTYRGRGAWLELGHGRKQDGRLIVPASATKNKKEINAPIKANSRLRGLETLHWYEKKIRPLFPYHADSDYLFPAVKTAGQPLGYPTLLKWWQKTIGDIGFPGMNPHMFRHGQASILVANSPGDWQTVSVRLGDTEDTCQKHYAWIHEEALILEGQRRLTEGLFHAA